MDTFSIREVVEMAIRTEGLGHSYYNDLAIRFQNNTEAHKLFKHLAERELVHQEQFTELRETLGDTEPEGWEEVSEYMRAYVESAFFLGKEKSMLHMQNITDTVQAVALAIGFEKETLLFFYAMREAVREKEIVDEIINEEKSHIVWLTIFKQKSSS